MYSYRLIVSRPGSALEHVADTAVAEAREFWNQADERLPPALWEAEIANVLWMATRAKVVTAQDATAKLALAGRLGILWHGALARSVSSGVAVYDTLFVELAEREGIPMATLTPRP